MYTHNPHRKCVAFLALSGLFKVVRPFLCNCIKEGSDNVVKKKMKLVTFGPLQLKSTVMTLV